MVRLVLVQRKLKTRLVQNQPHLAFWAEISYTLRFRLKKGPRVYFSSAKYHESKKSHYVFHHSFSSNCKISHGHGVSKEAPPDRWRMREPSHSLFKGVHSGWFKRVFSLFVQYQNQPHLAFWDEINYSKCVLAIITELRVISVLSRNPPKRVFFRSMYVSCI